MSDEVAARRKRGRPPGTGAPRVLPEDRTKPRTMRITDARWNRLKRLGIAWLNKHIDEAPDELLAPEKPEKDAL